MSDTKFSDAIGPWFDIQHPMNQTKPRRYTVQELEDILNREEDAPIEILPNGEIRAVDPNEKRPTKPLTMRENLGGEYAP